MHSVALDSTVTSPVFSFSTCACLGLLVVLCFPSIVQRHTQVDKIVGTPGNERKTHNGQGNNLIDKSNNESKVTENNLMKIRHCF